MARKEIDPVRAKSALAVAKQHPGMILFLASPAIIAVVLVGVFVGTGWAVLLALALLVAGGLVLRRNL
ncbi:hypothetical protein [Mycobacterium sp. HM-7]